MYEGFALAKELKDEKKREERLARIEDLENAVFEQCAGVIEALMGFHQVSPNQVEPPPEWIAQFGREIAMQKLAVAKSGWLPPSIAPSAVNHAVKLYVGITRGKKHNLRLIQNNVNVKIALPAPTSREHPGPVEYEVRDLET